ncbi:SurA N-terminal domain-containing protein [Deltaproteobacteria bacterium TL4]
MIQELREHSQSLFFKILLGFIAITFIISFGIGSFLGDQKEVIAKVNHSEILMKDHRRAYSLQMENMKQNFGERAEQIAEQLNLNQQVLDQLISQNLLLSEADSNNFLLTDSELQDFIKNQPYFQREGRFDFETYKTILKQNRMTIDEYESNQRRELLLQKVRDVLGGSLVVSEAEVNQIFQNENEKVEVQYVDFKPETFVEKAEFTEEELSQYYEKNIQKFQTNRQFKIEYFKLTLEHFKTKEVKERETKRYYERNQEQYTTQAEVKARHILFKVPPEATEEIKVAKRLQLEALRTKIVEGADFEEMAKEHSEDLSKTKGGDLGWFKSGDMVAEFEAAAFALEQGGISSIIESPFGLHLIKVDDKKPKVVKSFDEVKEEINETLSQSYAEKKLDKEFDRLQQRMDLEKNLAAIAESYGSPIESTELFDSESVIPGLGSAKDLTTQLRHAKVEEFGHWKRNPVQGHVFYRVVAIAEPKSRPLEGIREQVIQAVKQDKSKEIAKETAQKALTNLAEGTPLSSIAQIYKLKEETVSFTTTTRYLQNVGENEEFKKTALSLSDKNKYGLSQKEDKVYLIELKSRKLDTENANDKKEKIRGRLNEQLHRMVINKKLKQLKESAKIEILNPRFRAVN